MSEREIGSTYSGRERSGGKREIKEKQGEKRFKAKIWRMEKEKKKYFFFKKLAKSSMPRADFTAREDWPA